MKNTEICKKYFDMHKTLLKETQFNKKVNLNIEISNFKRLNNIQLSSKDLDTEIFIGINMIGIISPKYAKKDKNLECKFIGYKYEIIKN
jgi:hypothetical protein